MAYTIRISSNSPQALGIVNLLRVLAKDYDFLHITEESNTLTAEQEKELNRRFEFVENNPTVGKTWEEFEENL